MIDIKGLRKSFGNLTVLDGIDLSIESGLIYGLIGRSGAGKSTLLRCINGLTSIDGGEIWVEEVNVNRLSKREMKYLRKEIGMIFQNFSLLNRLSVYENIALPLKCWKYDKDHIKAKVNELSEIIGIKDKLKAKPLELSGGQKQRVAIARALAMEPKVLLSDEATSSLDPQTTQSILSLLTTINKELGITIVVVTHEMSVIKSICQDVAILENGRVMAKGDVTRIFIQQPPALIHLTGNRKIIQPENGVSIEIYLDKSHSSKPLLSKMARSLDLDFQIIGGDFENFKNDLFILLVINFEKEKMGAVENFLNDEKVLWKLYETSSNDRVIQ